MKIDRDRDVPRAAPLAVPAASRPTRASSAGASPSSRAAPKRSRAAVDVLADYLIGQDPLRIEDHWQVLTKGGFYRGGPVLSSAVAGLDQALWDIAGKAYGVPVHALLGGPVRDTGPGLRLGRRRRARASSPRRPPRRSRRASPRSR